MLRINEKPILNTSKKIVDAYYATSLAAYTAVGWQGIGKSTFCLHSLFDIYQDWDVVKQFFFFEKSTASFKTKFNELYHMHGRIPFVCLDDLGTWFSKYLWHEALSKNLYKTYNLIRNRCSGIIATSIESEDVAKFLRSKFRYTLTFQSAYNISNRYLPDQEKWVVATCYEKHFLPDGSDYIEKCFEDIFNLYIPKDIRDWHWQMREEVSEELDKESEQLIIEHESFETRASKKAAKRSQEIELDNKIKMLMAKVGGKPHV